MSESQKHKSKKRANPNSVDYNQRKRRNKEHRDAWKQSKEKGRMYK